MQVKALRASDNCIGRTTAGLTRSKFLRLSVFSSAITPLALLTGGCWSDADVAATKKYSEEFTGKASTLFPMIASEVYLTCIRQADYQLLDLPPSPVFQTRDAFIAERCNPRQGGRSAAKASEELAKLHSTLTTYIQALGMLASDDIANFKPEVDALFASLEGFNTATGNAFLDEAVAKQTFEAAGSLASILANAITKGYQREQLASIISESDSRLATMIRGLTLGIQTGYIEQLDNENLAIRLYYQNYLGDALSQPETTRTAAVPLAAANLHSGYIKTQNTVRGKKQLAARYISLLKKMSCSHSKLVDRYAGSSPKVATANGFCKAISNPASISLSSQGQGSVDSALHSSFDEILRELEEITQSFESLQEKG